MDKPTRVYGYTIIRWPRGVVLEGGPRFLLWPSDSEDELSTLHHAVSKYIIEGYTFEILEHCGELPGIPMEDVIRRAVSRCEYWKEHGHAE